MTFDPIEIRDDPFPAFAAARKSGGLLPGAYPGVERAYYVFSHELVSLSLKHPLLAQSPSGPYQSFRQTMAERPVWNLLFRSLLLTDIPEHSKLRRPLNGFQTNWMESSFNAFVMDVARETTERAVAKGRFDAVRDIAIPTSFAILGHALGIRLPDPWNIHEDTGLMASALDFRPHGLPPPPEADEACERLKARVRAALHQQDYSSEGMVAAMISEARAGRWNDDHVVANIVFLLFAGQQTIVDAFSSALKALCDSPDQRSLLADGSVTAIQAANELLRFYPAVQYAGARIAAEDLVLDGHSVRAGESVVPVLASANRDHEIFPDGDALRLNRAPSRSMSFGAGLHVCLGQQLARVELAAMLSSLISTAPNWRLDTDGLREHGSTLFRGFSSVPIYLEA